MANGHHNGKVVVEESKSQRERALERDLEVAHLRTEVAIDVSRHVFAFVDEEYDKLHAVIDDVLDRWLTRTDGDRQRLSGPQGFIEAYFARVEFEDPKTELRWEQFIPAGSGEYFDEDKYYRNVWEAHADALLKRR